MRTSEDRLVELIRSSGLDVHTVQGDEPGPSVGTAWRAMAGFGVEPSASLPLKGDLEESTGCGSNMPAEPMSSARTGRSCSRRS